MNKGLQISLCVHGCTIQLFKKKKDAILQQVEQHERIRTSGIAEQSLHFERFHFPQHSRSLGDQSCMSHDMLERLNIGKEKKYHTLLRQEFHVKMTFLRKSV